MADDTDDPVFKCKFCGKDHSSRKDCTNHERFCDKFVVTPQSSDSTTSESPPVPPPADKIFCKHCHKIFTLRKNCLRHERTCFMNESAGTSFKCEFCGSTSRREDNHKVHVRKCQEKRSSHGESSKQGLRSKTPCLIADCDEEFYHKIGLIEHLKTCHKNVKICDPISKEFNSVNEFHLWKDEEQEKTFSYFSQKSGQNSSKVKYFYCQHDGVSHSKRKTQRHNFKGRVKVGHFCIAKMQVWKDDKEKIHVLYFPTHNHLCNPADFVHHPMSKKTDMYINERIAWGVSPTKILRDVQKKDIPRTASTHDIQNCKSAVLTKKRIRERARKRREKMRYHKDEATSVYLMVKKLCKEDGDIILYKPYGADVVVGPKEVNSLPNHKDLFMLGIQTKRQAQLMADHCHKIVLVDETHGTNHHAYQLLTLMIIDDNRRGWPVGHLITSKSDAETLQYFFKALKENVPDGVDLNINCVISDDDAALINAMDLGFCGSLGKLRHILCKWHLLRSLKKNLKSHVPKNMVDQMMTELRVLVNEKDQTVFKNLQAGFIAKYKDLPQTKTYIEYYQKHYEKRMEKWAMCFRNYPHANINTTGHLESFHHRLKKVYLKRKVNRRVDDLLTILLDLEWDDHVARIREAYVGMASQPQDVLMRHMRAMSMKDDILKQIDETTWDIKASSGKEIYYIVKYHDKCPSDHCFSKCSQIACHSLCAHMYSCSCKDNHPLCKHVHKLHSFLTRDLSKQVRDNEMCTHDSTFPSIEREEEEEANVPQIQVPHDSENRRTLAKSIQEFEENLSELSNLFSSEKGICNSLAKSNAVAHAAHVTGELILQLKYMSSEDIDDVAPMEPVLKFNSNEKLKTQASQVPSFKRPPAKRKNQAQGVCPEKKQAVVKDLLSMLQSPNSDEKFTPPLSFVPNPSDVILKCSNESLTLLNLKSLEHTLPPDELTEILEKDPAFHVGWLYSSVINAYMDSLQVKYPSVLSLSSDLAWRASHGRSNSNYLGRELQDTNKDVLLLPANLTGNHWCIIAVLLDLSQVWYYDPLQNKLNSATETLLFQVCSDLKMLFPESEWETIVYVQAARQTDSSSCGVHICCFAEQISRKSHPYVAHSNINAFRKCIYDSIVGECLKREFFDSEQCGVCSEDFSDNSDNNGNVWISCTKCEQWYHQACVGLHGNDFVCPLVRELNL